MANDNAKIAESLSEKINYEFVRNFLVKPLDPIMIKKEFETPIPSKTEPTKDENGIEATDFEEVKKEIKEVESDYRKGIVLKVPVEYTRQMNDEKFPATPIAVGDTIVYRARSAYGFDLLKDSQMIDAYSIIAIVK